MKNNSIVFFFFRINFISFGSDEKVKELIEEKSIIIE